MMDAYRAGSDHHIDLPSQLEELLSTVRWAEENWRFDDWLDLATRTEPRNRRRAA
jgi:hypothetical protein